MLTGFLGYMEMIEMPGELNSVLVCCSQPDLGWPFSGTDITE